MERNSPPDSPLARKSCSARDPNVERNSPIAHILSPYDADISLNDLPSDGKPHLLNTYQVPSVSTLDRDNLLDDFDVEEEPVDEELDIEEDIELMLQHHDDPSVNVLYMETRRRGNDGDGGSMDDITLGGALMLDGIDDVEEDHPIAPRAESVDSHEDWDVELGVDEEIKGAQQEMASGFRSLISKAIDLGSFHVPGGGKAAAADDDKTANSERQAANLHSILSDELTTFQSIMPELDVAVTIPNRCKFVSQLLFGKESDSVMPSALLQAPVLSKSQQMPELVTVLGPNHKRLRLSIVEVDRLLRRVVSKNATLPRRQDTSKPVVVRPLSHPHRSESKRSKSRDPVSSLKSTSLRGSSPPSPKPSPRAVHRLSPTVIHSMCDKISSLFRAPKGSSLEELKTCESKLYDQIKDLQVVVVSYCDAPDVVSPSTRLINSYGWRSATLLYMFRQLYGVLEILAILQGGGLQWSRAPSVGVEPKARSSSDIKYGKHSYRFVLFAHSVNDEQGITTAQLIEKEEQFKNTVFLDLLVAVSCLFPWFAADLALVELRAAAHLLALRCHQYGEVSANQLFSDCPSILQLMKRYLQLARYSMGYTRAKTGADTFFIVPKSSARLTHLENQNNNEKRTKDEEISSGSLDGLSSAKLQSPLRAGHQRSHTWSVGSRSYKSFSAGTAAHIKGEDTDEESSRHGGKADEGSQFANLYFSCIVLSDLGFILRGYLPLTLCHHVGLVKALQAGNAQINASHPSGIGKVFGSAEYILENLFYRQVSLDACNTSSCDSEGVAEEDTDDLVVSSDDGDIDDDDSLELEIIESDTPVASTAVGAVPKLNLKNSPLVADIVDNPGFGPSVPSPISASSAKDKKERSLVSSAAANKLITTTPRGLSNSGQPLSARSSRSLDHSQHDHSGYLNQQNLYSETRIYQCVKEIMLQRDSSDTECIRYLLKNCRVVEESASRTGSYRSKGGGGGAEMVFALLKNVYEQLPAEVSAKNSGSHGPVLLSIFSIAVSSRSSENYVLGDMRRASEASVTSSETSEPPLSRTHEHVDYELIRQVADHSKCLAATCLAMLCGNIDPVLVSRYMERSEAYLLEAVYILNNGWMERRSSPEVDEEELSAAWVNTGLSMPPLSPLGAFMLEHLGDVFRSRNKHKLGILSYESCLSIHLNLSSLSDNKLYRKLSLAAQEAGDVRRSLFYNCILLKFSQSDGNVNEFVYLSKSSAKLCVELGELPFAERLLRLSNLVHIGMPISHIKFEKLNLLHLPHHLLPHGLKVPGFYVGTTPINSPGQQLGIDASDAFLCDSQQVDILMQLCDVLMLSHQNIEAVAICQVILADQQVPFSCRYKVLLRMATSLYSMGQYPCAEAALNAICSEVDHLLHSTLAKRPIWTRCCKISSRHALSSPKSEQFLDHPVITTACVREVNEYHGQLVSILSSMSNNVSLAVGFLKSPEYLLLRARVAKAMNKYMLAIGWLELLLQSRATKSGSPTASSVSMHPNLMIPPALKGLALYLKGRCYAMLALNVYSDASDEPAPIDGDIGGKGGAPVSQANSFRHAFSRAERCYQECIDMFRISGDTVRESKACYRWTELYISMLFDKVVAIPISGKVHNFNRDWQHDSHPEKVEERILDRSKVINKILISKCGAHMDGLEHMEIISRHGLLMAGECGAPMVAIFSMLACVELAIIQEKELLAINYWREIYALLTVTYLQPLASDFMDEKLFGSPDSPVVKSTGSPYKHIRSSYSALREPLEVPCRYSTSILKKLVDIVQRLLRLAYCLPVHATGGSGIGGEDGLVSNADNSDNDSQLSTDAVAQLKSFDLAPHRSGMNAPTNSQSNMTPLSLHSQLAVTLYRLEYAVKQSCSPIYPAVSESPESPNPVLVGYILKCIEFNENRQRIDFGKWYFPEYLTVDTRTRLSQSIFHYLADKVTGHKAGADISLGIARRISIGLEDLFALEIQRLILSSCAYTDGSGGCGLVSEHSKGGSMTIIDGVMSNIVKMIVNGDSDMSSSIVYVSARGTIVTAALSIESSGQPEKRVGTSDTMHMSSVIEVACDRCCVSNKHYDENKKRITEYLCALNDAYGQSSPGSFEFNACVSISHQNEVPILPRVYDKVEGALGNLYSATSRILKVVPRDHIFGLRLDSRTLLMAFAIQFDYLEALNLRKMESAAGDIKDSSPRRAVKKSEVIDIPPKTPGRSPSLPESLPKTVVENSLHSTSGSSKKFDFAVPVAIAVQSSASYNNRTQAFRKQTAAVPAAGLVLKEKRANAPSTKSFKMKVLIPKKIRTAFSSTDDTKKKHVPSTSFDSATSVSSASHTNSRRKDWELLLRKIKPFEPETGAVNSLSRPRLIGHSPRFLNHNSTSSTGRLDSFYASLRFEVLFTRLHAHAKDYTGRGPHVGLVPHSQAGSFNSIQQSGSDMTKVLDNGGDVQEVNSSSRLLFSPATISSEESIGSWAKQLKQAGTAKMHPNCIELRRMNMTTLRFLVKNACQYAHKVAQHENYAAPLHSKNYGHIRRNTSETALDSHSGQKEDLALVKAQHELTMKMQDLNSPSALRSLYKGTVDLSNGSWMNQRTTDIISPMPMMSATPSPPPPESHDTGLNGNRPSEVKKVATHLLLTPENLIVECRDKVTTGPRRRRSTSQSGSPATVTANPSTLTNNSRIYAGIFSSLIFPTYYSYITNPGTTSVSPRPAAVNSDILTPLYPSGYFVCVFLSPCLYLFFPTTGQRIIIAVSPEKLRSNGLWWELAAFVRSNLHPRKSPVLYFNVNLHKKVLLLSHNKSSQARKVDDSLRVLYKLLGVDKLIFLLTCICFEQSVLFVAPPGSEELLCKCVTGLYELCMPLTTDFLCIPVASTSIAELWMKNIDGAGKKSGPVQSFHGRIGGKSSFASPPFIIGTYHGLLDKLDHPVQKNRGGHKYFSWETAETEGQGYANDLNFEVQTDNWTLRRVEGVAGSPGGGSAFTHLGVQKQPAKLSCTFDDTNVTVVDILNGTLWPGRRMLFSAAVTASEWQNNSASSRLDSDPEAIRYILSELNYGYNGRSCAFLPCLPPRCRDILRSCDRGVKGSAVQHAPLKPDIIRNPDGNPTLVLSMILNFHIMLTQMLCLVPLFCRVLDVFEDGCVCECFDGSILDKTGEESYLPYRTFSDRSHVMILRTAAKSSMCSGVQTDDSHDTQMGRFGNSQQFTELAATNIIKKLCSCCGITLRPPNRKRKLPKNSCSASMKYRICNCAENILIEGAPKKIVVVSIILFDEDSFLEHAGDEIRPFMFHFCRLKNFERLVIGCLRGDACTQAIIVDAESYVGSKASMSSTSNLKPAIFPVYYPISTLHDMLTERISKYMKYKYSRVAGFMNICVVRVIPAANKNEAYGPRSTLSHVFPIRIVSSSSGQAHGQSSDITSSSSTADVDLQESMSEYEHCLGTIETSRFKKRWCILDGYRFSYYKQKSQTVIKGSVQLTSVASESSIQSEQTVRLLLPPYVKDVNGSAMPIFGLDCRSRVNAGDAKKLGEIHVSQSREIVLLFCPHVTASESYTTADNNTGTVPSLKLSYIDEFRDFDQDTNKWLTILSSRLAPVGIKETSKF